MEAVKEQTILERVAQLKHELDVLVANIDNLVERNPLLEGGRATREREAIVFDEILCELSECGGLAIESIEKIQDGISRKVQ